MTDDLPPKLERETSDDSSDLTKTSSATPPTPDELQVTHEQQGKTTGKPDDKQVTPSDEQVKSSDDTKTSSAAPKPALSLTQLAQAGIKPLPKKEAEIPEHLYTLVQSSTRRRESSCSKAYKTPSPS